MIIKIDGEHYMRDKCSGCVSPCNECQNEVSEVVDENPNNTYGYKVDYKAKPSLTEWAETKSVAADMVKEPSHYKILPDKDVEAIDVIRAVLTEEEFAGYCRGNVIKYALRNKFDNEQDLAKAGQYIKFLLED